MTVSYQYDVASSSTGGFFRLLWRWRGSIWKLLYKELLLFIGIYLTIALSYDFLMAEYYKRYYERIVIFCSAFVEIIPLSFILGFYVSFTATRWWQQYTAIPWPDKLMNIIALYVPGNDVTSRVLRRTLMRYLNLTLVLVLRSISIPVKRRFPTKEHLVEAGFMSRPELEMYSSVPSHEFNTFWIPCTWFVNLLREAKSECRITDSGGIKLIMEEFNEFRSKCGLLWSYDWVSIPLVYTQVVTLSTQAFFLASLLGRQHINPPKEHDIKNHAYGEYYIPVFTLLQFILYMGMLKLGEQLINPFGDDDEDFELNWIIDRHLKVSFLGVDILNSDPPPLIKDNYFDEMDIKLPYTEAAVAHKVKTYRGSVAAFHVPTEKHGLVIPEFEDEKDDEEDDDSSTIQSNKDVAGRSAAWSLFGYKRKLSSSIDSFNSETMVETGLGHEVEMPQLTSNSSWPNFLRSEAELGPEAKLAAMKAGGIHMADIEQPEGTQGIRWSYVQEAGGVPTKDGTRSTVSKGEPCSKDPMCSTTAGASNRTATTTGSKQAGDPFKQSSFSTSDSSLVLPPADDSDRRSSSNSGAKFFIFDKSPLQVFSKEFSNVPLSVLRDLESNKATDRHSLSSQSSSTRVKEKLSKPGKSVMKSHRTVDPKLRIRPFRSKVTFSEDTKAGSDTPEMREKHNDRDGQGNRISVFTKWDSSSDSVASMLRAQEEVISLKRPRFALSKPVQAGTQQSSTLKASDMPFADLSKRRQSLDPTLYNKSVKPVEPVTQDNWLHYQSLPNIQEEEMSSPASPTDMTPTGEQSRPSTPSSLSNKVSVPKNNTNTNGHNIQAKLLSPESSVEGASPPVSTRRRSIKRQKSQEIADEDIAARQALVPPIKPPMQSTKKVGIMKKQASNESESSNLTDNSTTSTSAHHAPSNKTTMAPPPGILRKRKEDLKPRQASTESDTGSYHTVRSFRTQLETSNSSSVDSFTSAISESNNSNSQSSGVVAIMPAVTSSPTPTTQSITPTNGREVVVGSGDIAIHSLSTEHLPNQQQYLPAAYATMQSTLVPKIVFSQSTPSVTSQSSDDQNSPRWDENKDFSSIDTVIEYSYRIPRQSAPMTSSGSISRPPIPPPPPTATAATTSRTPAASETLRFESSQGVVCVRLHPQQSQDSVIDIDEDSNTSGSHNSQQQQQHQNH